MIEVLEDGTQIVYMLRDWTPVDKDRAEMVHIRKPDGEELIAYPEPEEPPSAPSANPPATGL